MDAQPSERIQQDQRVDRVSRFDWLVMLSLLAWPLLLWVVVRHRPPWGDEIHFLETVRLFGLGVSIDLLRAYPEMSAPFTYIVYAAWGQLVGFSTPALRLLSPFIAWATASIWFLFVLRPSLRSPALVLLALATVVLNPYFVGLSVFVFTDMLALLGMAIVTASVQNGRPWIAAIGLAVATCARQYLVFLAPALVAAAWLATPRTSSTRRFMGAAVAGLIPLGLLVILWDWHLAPAHNVRDMYLSEGVRFDPHALSLYLAAPGAYLLPLVVSVARKASLRIWLTAAALANFVWFVPIQPSIAQTREGVFTAGFLHRALVAALPANLVDVVFAALAALTLAGLIVAGKGVLRWTARERPRAVVFHWATTVAFLVVMPFSYMPWDKYALPLFMAAGVILALTLERLVIPRGQPGG